MELGVYKLGILFDFYFTFSVFLTSVVGRNTFIFELHVERLRIIHF